MKFGTKQLSVIGILLFVAIIWKTNFVGILSSVRLVEPVWIGVVLVTVLFEVLLRASRWQVLSSVYS